MKYFIMGLILAVVSIGAPPAIRVGISSVLHGRDMYYDHERVVGTPG